MTEQKRPDDNSTDQPSTSEEALATAPETDQQTQVTSELDEGMDAKLSEPAEPLQPGAESELPAESDADADVETEARVPPEPAPEPESERKPETPVPAAAKPKGRLLALLALLLSLGALGGAGYVYYELVYLQPLARVESEGAQLTARYDQLAADLRAQIAALESDTSAAIKSLEGEQETRLASNEEAVLKSLNEAINAAPPGQREWKLAEAEYLLRIANHRVLMEEDATGALSLLQAVDQIMAELDDFALHQVRARLADEIIALRQVPRDDIQGIFLRLESIKSQLDTLPLPEPQYLQSTAVQQPEQSVWQTLLDELKKFIRLRSLSSEEAIRPLLAPDEIRYLQLNLRLAMEQAQLALLKRQQEVYEQSLLNVRRWITDHADVADERTVAVLGSVDELLVIELERPLPDISGSLNELLSLRRSGA